MKGRPDEPARLPAAQTKKPAPFGNRLSLNLVAGAGFEPATFARGYKGLSPTSLLVLLPHRRKNRHLSVTGFL
jgi:hypothetical protein